MSFKMGALIASAKTGPTAIEVYGGGITLRHDAQVFSGSWSSVAAIAFQIRRVTVNGIPLPRFCFFSLRTEGGAEFRIDTRNKELANAFEAAFAASEPALTQRVLGSWQKGEELDFGAIRLSRGRISVKKRKGWEEVLLEDLSGFRIENGYFLADRGTQPARLFAEILGSQIENLLPLLAVLRSARPDADLSVPENEARQYQRRSARPWGPPSAATRVPGTMTGRGRVALLGVPAALAVLYGLVLVPLALSLSSEREERAARIRALAEVGERSLSNAPALNQPLKEACEGKLSHQERGVVAYFGDWSEAVSSKLDRYSRDVPRKTLVGATVTGLLKEESLKWIRGGDFADAWMWKLTGGPGYRDIPGLDPSSTRYIAAARVRDLNVVPTTYGGKRLAAVELDVQVLAADDGRVVCEGITRYDVPEARRSSGASAVAIASLREICEAGTKSLCEEISDSEKQ